MTSYIFIPMLDSQYFICCYSHKVISFYTYKILQTHANNENREELVND